MKDEFVRKHVEAYQRRKLRGDLSGDSLVIDNSESA